MDDGIHHLLTRMPAFAGADEDQLEGFAKVAIEASAGPGEVVDPEGPLVVRSGGLRVFDAQERAVDVVGEGEFWAPLEGLRAEALALTDYLILPDEAIDTAWATITEQRLRTVVSAPTLQGAAARLAGATVDAIMRRPVIVDGSTPIVDVAEELTRAEISGALVTGGPSLGIVTDQDIRSRFVARGAAAGGVIADVATMPVVTTTGDTHLLDALETLVGNGIRHLPVVENGRPVGMVVGWDLLSLVGRNPFGIQGEIAGAATVGDLERIHDALPGVTAALFEAGMDALSIARIQTLFTDQILEKVIGDILTTMGGQPTPFAWVALGSQGRREQTFVTDQDSALVYPTGIDPEWLAGFSEEVVATLEQIGYPRCEGKTMASEAQWRDDVDQWHHRWASFLVKVTPDHVLSTNIALDSRVVVGDPALAEPFEMVRKRARHYMPLMIFLAATALDFRPPLGFLGRLVVARGGEHAGTLDLKAGAIMPIVSIARVHGLAAASPSVSTVERIRDAAADGQISADLADMLHHGYELAMQVRLEHQVSRWRAGTKPDNRIYPDELNSWRRTALKEVFKSVREAQDSLSSDYHGSYTR